MTPIANERLAGALQASGLSRAQLAARVGVDSKTVERWVAQGRTPHPATRAKVAELLGHEASLLWSSTATYDAATIPADVVRMWPRRDLVPSTTWQTLIDTTTGALDVLAYSAGFLVESFRLVDRIGELSAAGGRVRVAIGDPTAPAVVERGQAEGLPSLPARAASTAEYLAPVLGLPGVELRVHSTPLYASIYRFDDTLIVNSHSHGSPANRNPVTELRDAGGPMWLYWRDAFERVWSDARPRP